MADTAGDNTNRPRGFLVLKAHVLAHKVKLSIFLQPVHFSLSPDRRVALGHTGGHHPLHCGLHLAYTW